MVFVCLLSSLLYANVANHHMSIVVGGKRFLFPFFLIGLKLKQAKSRSEVAVHHYLVGPHCARPPSYLFDLYKTLWQH